MGHPKMAMFTIYIWDTEGNILMQLPGNNNQNINILYNHIHINEIIIK